jgi:hypothetical protein
MDDNKKVFITGALIFVLLIAAGSMYYFVVYKKKGEAAPAEKPVAGQVVSPDESAEKRREEITGLSVNLDQSDDVIRKYAGELSSNSLFAQWLKSRDLVRKFTAAVDSIANGSSPRPQMDFFKLSGSFKVMRRGGRLYLDSSSYERYNIVADVFNSLSTSESAIFYRELRPLFQQAYRELGYPTEDFHQTLLRAIGELLKTPVVEGSIQLERKVTTYVMTDTALENLSPAQKHLLRMGPENVQLIQVKLRELALAIGFTESQLPRQRIHTP